MGNEPFRLSDLEFLTHSSIRFSELTWGVIWCDRPTDRLTEKPNNRQTDRANVQQTDWPENRPTDRLTEKPTNRQTDRETDQQTDWPRNRPTDRLTEKPTNRQTDWETDHAACRWAGEWMKKARKAFWEGTHLHNWPVAGYTDWPEDVSSAEKDTILTPESRILNHNVLVDVQCWTLKQLN